MAGAGEAWATVSDGMTATEKDAARTVLQQAGDEVRQAINLSRRGQNGDALRAYRSLFGDLFPCPETWRTKSFLG